MNNPVLSSPTGHGNKTPKLYTLSAGQQNGVKGQREGASNRQQKNPDGSKRGKK